MVTLEHIEGIAKIERVTLLFQLFFKLLDLLLTFFEIQLQIFDVLLIRWFIVAVGKHFLSLALIKMRYGFLKLGGLEQVFLRHVGSVILDEFPKAKELGLENIDLLEGEIFHLLKGAAVLTLQLSNAFPVLLADFKYLVVEVLLDCRDL